MGKKVVGIIFVCVVILVAIAIAVIASVATKSTKEEEVPSKEEPNKEEPSKEEVPNKEALVEGEEEDFFCCRDKTNKLPRSQVKIFKKYSCFENLQRYKISSIKTKLYYNKPVYTEGPPGKTWSKATKFQVVSVRYQI